MSIISKVISKVLPLEQMCDNIKTQQEDERSARLIALQVRSQDIAGLKADILRGRLERQREVFHENFKK